MRILSALTAVFLLTLCLSACQPEISVDTNPSTTESTLPETEPDTVPQKTEPPALTVIPENLYSVSVPVTTEYGYADDEAVVFSYAYQTMHLIHPDRDVADKIIIDFLGRVEETRSNADQLYSFALTKDHQAESFTPYFYQIHYNPTRIDQGVLSLHGHISQNGDFAHSNVQCVSANYDMVTGDALTLGSILYRAEVKDQLCKLVISALEARTDIILFDDFRNSVTNRFARDESLDNDFYFTTTGLVCYFSPYEVAPYSSGTVTVEIPYHQLTGIIGDAYFPAEQTNSSGSLTVCDFAEANLEDYTQFAEIIVDSGSSKLLLTTDSIVQDIQIKMLTWTEDGNSHLDPNTVFAANKLAAQEAILIDARLNDERPSFIVSYSIDGINHDFYLTYEGSNISLVADYIP